MSLAGAASQSAPVSLSSALSAVLAEEGPNSVPKAAQLVTLDTVQYPQGVLVWAIQVMPEGGYIAPGGPMPIPGMTTRPVSTVQYNYQLDFVNATTGQWLQAIESYDPALGSQAG